MEMPSKVAKATSLYNFIFVMINNSLFLMTKKNLSLELIEVIIFVGFTVISLAVGELLGNLCKGKGGNRIIRMAVTVLIVIWMLIEIQNAINFK